MAASRPALFGKLPKSLDFVRIHHDSHEAIALDEWTQDAVLELARANASWPSQNVRFLFAAPGLERALVGVIASSRDRAGRKFPLTVFCSLSVASYAGRFAALPRLWQPFFEAADALVADAASLGRPELTERLEALPRPLEASLGESLCVLESEVDQHPASEFARSAEQLDIQASLAHCVQALGAAVTGPEQRAVTLDCPVVQPLDTDTWLLLAQRSLAWRTALPSLFWTLPAPEDTSGSRARLLLSLGAPPALVPLWLQDARRRHARLVQLRTGGSGARDVAATMGQLLAAFTPQRGA